MLEIMKYLCSKKDAGITVQKKSLRRAHRSFRTHGVVVSGPRKERLHLKAVTLTQNNNSVIQT